MDLGETIKAAKTMAGMKNQLEPLQEKLELMQQKLQPGLDELKENTDKLQRQTEAMAKPQAKIEAAIKRYQSGD